MSTLTDAPFNLVSVIRDEGGLEELRELSPTQRDQLFAKLGAVLQVNRMPKGRRGTVRETLARQLGVTPHAIRAWQSAWKRAGFRGLIDRRRVGSGSTERDLPEVTRKWIRAHILQSKRKGDGIAEVHRIIIDRWHMWRRTGDVEKWGIPGYSTPPPDCGKGHPAGMSYENIRKCQPSKHTRTAAFEGPVAAYRDLPSILQTRVGKRYLQFVFFDDQKYDTLIRVPGYERSMVPMGFNALDYLTAYAFEPHIRLRWYDEDSSTHKQLTCREFTWYAITRLCCEGYRDDEHGTTYIQEHGTAKLWSTMKSQRLSTVDGHHSFDDAIAALTGGRVKIDDSGIFNKPLFQEMLYGPRPSGNPRFKAPIESFFHAVRTHHSLLIGATGRDPRAGEAPEENYGIELYERSIYRAAKDLPDNIREAVLSNFLSGLQFGQMAHLIYDALNARDYHQLRDWKKLDHYSPMWRWPEDPDGFWRPRSELARLPQHIREHAQEFQAQDPSLTRLACWSPAQAMQHYRQDPAIVRPKLVDLALCLPREWAKPVTVTKRHGIDLTDELLPGEDLQYLPELKTPRGRCEYLQPGDHIHVHINPLMPDEILAYDQQMAFIGTLTRNVAPDLDTDKLAELYAHRARLRGAIEAPARAAAQPEAARRAAIRELNADLIAGVKESTTIPNRTAKPTGSRSKSSPDPFAPAPAEALASREEDPFI